MKVLFFSLSEKWSPREWQLVKDLERASSAGIEIVLFCRKDSFVNEFAQKISGIHYIYSKHVLKRSFFNDRKIAKEVRKVYSREDISLVHYYDLRDSLVLVRSLRFYPWVSLFLTCIKEIGSKQGLIDRKLLSRVDAVFTLSYALKKSFEEIFHYPIHKIHTLSFEFSVKPSSYKEDTILGIYFFGDELDTSSLDSLFHLLGLFEQKYERKFEIHLGTDREWESFVIRKDLEEVVVKYNLLDEISYKSCVDIDSFMANISILMVPDLYSKFYYPTNIALLANVPILAPRSAIFSDLEEMTNGAVQTYKWEDVRDGASKLDGLVENYEKLRNKLIRNKGNIRAGLGLDDFSENVIELYHRSIQKRTNFLIRKGRKHQF